VAQVERMRNPHGCDYEADSLLECDAVYFVKTLQILGAQQLLRFQSDVRAAICKLLLNVGKRLSDHRASHTTERFHSTEKTGTVPQTDTMIQEEPFSFNATFLTKTKAE